MLSTGTENTHRAPGKILDDYRERFVVAGEQRDGRLMGQNANA